MMGTPLSWAPLAVVLFLCLGSLSCCHAAEIGTAHSTVIDLTAENFDDYIMGVRKQYLTMRDLWTSWLIVGVWRAFCALWVMICTPNDKDAKVGPIVQTLMKKYHFTSPESVLVAFKDLSYVEAAQKLGSELNPIMYHTNKASYILQTSLLCFLLEDGMPKTFEGLVSLPGVGPKIGDIVMFDGLGEVTGIPVDSHLARILVSLEWAEDGSDEEIAHSAMSWMPRECWGVVNECFAGLGQLLNDDQWKLRVKQELLDVPEDELWMLEPIKALLAVYKL